MEQQFKSPIDILDTSLETNALFADPLPGDDETWTIQVIYPDGESPDAPLLTEDTLIPIENVDEMDQTQLEKGTEVEIDEQEAKSHKKTITTVGYVCPKCKKIYNARRNLVRHLNLECGKEPKYTCTYCDYKNHRRNEITKHVRKKHGIYIM
ncbi:hypothetical protein JTB14_033822 [Gonioctena quinquepunctata]|nr:hypothetical protein JTB14_033822 [Gonioctena quinquepunctata]